MTSKKARPKSITEYINAAPKEARKKLREMRACIRASAPGAKESLKWGMPAFSYQRILVTFAAFKHHIGFYPTPSAVRAFANDLSKFVTDGEYVPLAQQDPALWDSRMIVEAEALLRRASALGSIGRYQPVMGAETRIMFSLSEACSCGHRSPDRCRHELPRARRNKGQPGLFWVPARARSSEPGGPGGPPAQKEPKERIKKAILASGS